MNEFLESIKLRDPAAKSILSIILTYPGVKAVFFHKISNFFYVADFDLIYAGAQKNMGPAGTTLVVVK